MLAPRNLSPNFCAPRKLDSSVPSLQPLTSHYIYCKVPIKFIIILYSAVMATPSANAPQTFSRPWSDLPSETLKTISTKIPDLADYLHFRSVCPSWRRSSSPNPTHLPSQLPLLVLPRHPSSSDLSLFSLSTRRASTFRFPQLRNKIIAGSSSSGYLALIDASTSSLSLFNPLTQSLIHLPPVSTIPYYQGPDATRCHRLDRDTYEFSDSHETIDETDYVGAFGTLKKGYPWKVSLFGSPSRPGLPCLAAVTLSNAAEFAFCIVGGADKWFFTTTGLPWPNEHFVSKRGKLYCFDTFADCWCYDVLKEERLRITAPNDRNGGKFHVVSTLGGDMFMFLCHRNGEVRRVRVFELEEGDGESRYVWSEVKCMGEYAVFLSATYKEVVRAVELPGCRADCVYFSDVCGSEIGEREPEVHYVDVYDMKENRFEVVACHWEENAKANAQGFRNATWLAPCFT